MDFKELQHKIDTPDCEGLINMILSLKKTKQADDVIIMALQQYGYTDHSILGALEYVNKNIKELEKQNMVKENINTFSLVDIFNKAQTLKAQLRNYILEETLSVSAQNAISDIDRNFDFMKCQIIEQISNGVIDEAKSELGIAYKYSVVESLYNSLSKYDLNETKAFAKELMDLYNEHMYEFEAARFVNEASNGRSPYFSGQKNLVESMEKFLTESDMTEETFVSILEANTWSNKCNSLLSAIEGSKEPKEHVYDTYKVYESISPVATVDGKMIVNLFGENYSCDGRCFEKFDGKVTDSKYNNVLEGLGVMEFDAESKTLSYRSKYGKDLEYDLVESVARVGQMEFALDSILEFASAIAPFNIFNSKDDYNKVMKLLEAREIINEIDNCKTIVPSNASGIAHIFESAEGTIVMFVNGNGSRTMKFNLKSKLAEAVAQEINCKIDALFEAEIRKEDAAMYERECKINEIKDNLEFLNEKRSEFVSLLASSNNDQRILDTIALIDNEIVSFEKKLQKLI